MTIETTPQDRVDLRLLRRNRAGDRRAFSELLRRWTPRVRSLARTLATTDDDVERLVRAGTAELVVVVRELDPDGGGRFSTFAGRRIATAMRTDAGRPRSATGLAPVRPAASEDRTVVAVRHRPGTSFRTVVERPTAGRDHDGRTPQPV